jgi:hypothetical protein
MEQSIRIASVRPLVGNQQNPEMDRLGAFFDLLLRIDQRNHPELYESQQSRNSPDQTT